MVKRISKIDDIKNLNPTVACIGYFDGVHLGHQKLIKQTILQAKKLSVSSTLICFEPDPMEVITGIKSKHLTSYLNRLNIIKSFGIDNIIVIQFSDELMKLKSQKFVNLYLNKLNIKCLICGYDFSFGYKGLGNITDLIKYGKFETIVIPEYKIYGKKVSSTRIKQTFISGNFELTNKLLGWEYCLELKVLNCTPIGKKWLVEAKLKDSRGILPIDGTYGNGMKIINNRVYILGSAKLQKNQIVLTSFSKDE